MLRLKIITIGIIIIALFGAIMLLETYRSAMLKGGPLESAVPSPTKSQQQIRQETLAMRHYYDAYGDIYATLVLREMFEAGEITQEDYSEIYTSAGDALSRTDINEYHKIRDVLNCRRSRLSQKDLLKCQVILMEKMKSRPVLISIFDLPEQREEVEKELQVIDEWAASPDDGNTGRLESELVSERLSCGARVYLYYYIRGKSGNIEAIELDGKEYDPVYYIDSRINKWFNDALSELLAQNNRQKDIAASETAAH